MSNNVTKPKLLIVEGTHEEEFFKALLAKLGLDVQLDPRGGKSKIRARIRLLPTEQLFVSQQMQAVGIVQDADRWEKRPDGSGQIVHEKVGNAFASIADGLREANLPVPDGPGKCVEGQAGQPAMGIFIMPNNRDSGELEKLCLQAVSDRPEITCLEDYFTCAKEVGLKPGNEAKGKVMAWLALQEAPDCHLGRAAQRGYWPFEHEAFDELKQFLNSLFAV